MKSKKIITLLLAAVLFAVQVTVTLAAGEPTNATGVKAEGVNPTSIKVSWNAAKDTSGATVKNYRIYYGTTSVFKAQKGTYDSKVDTKDNTTSYTFTDLKEDTTYYFAVTALDSKGVESAEYSLEASAKTKPKTDTSTSTSTSSTSSSGGSTITVVKDCKTDFSCFLTNLSTCAAAKVNLTGTDKTYSYLLELAGTNNTDCKVKYTASTHPNTLYQGNTMVCDVKMASYNDLTAYEKALDIKNCTGTLVNGYKTVVIKKDTTPPENITNLLANYKQQAKTWMVMLSWTPSINSAKDLIDQILYMSTNRGSSYDKGKSLGATAKSANVTNLESGKEYTFKITTKDNAGNESTGVVKSIRLPQTGMGVGLLLLGSLYGARRIMRRK